MPDMIDINKKTFMKVKIPLPEVKQPKQRSIFPDSLLAKLDQENQQIVKEAENDDDKQFSIGLNLIEGKNGFTKNTELAVKYLKMAVKNGNIEAAKYFSRVLLDGEILPSNPDKALKYLSSFSDNKDATVYTLCGIAYNMKNDAVKAASYFDKGANAGNAEAMYMLGKCLMDGRGVEKDTDKAKKYFEMAKNNGFKVPQKKSAKNQASSDDEKSDDSDKKKPKNKNKQRQNKKQLNDDDDDNSKTAPLLLLILPNLRSKRRRI